MSSDKEQRQQDPTAHALDAEKQVKRNPHPDFKKVEASRPDWDESKKWEYSKTRKPDWKLGDGANDGGECLKYNHVRVAARTIQEKKTREMLTSRWTG